MTSALADHLDLDACVEDLRALIRIPSVNPPDGGPELAAGHDPRGGETAAARHCADVLEAEGIRAEVVEITPGRGSAFARLRATVADPEPPLILLSHLDVVPVEAESWTRDPFSGELVDGEIWGRGAVDMKDMVAMEIGVMRALARSGAELRRDVIFAAVADEEAGGAHGARALVEQRPDLFTDAAGRPAAAALNEVGGYSMTLGGRRFYTIQVAEKGIAWTRLKATGTPGHGSMPHADNAATKLAAAVAAIAADAERRPGRVIDVVRGFLDAIGLGEVADAAEAGPDQAAEALNRLVEDPTLRRSIAAMLRDTATPNVIHAGTKVNVMAGHGEAEVDVRTLPGTDASAFLEHLQQVVGDQATVEPVVVLPPVEWPADAEIVGHMRDALAAADPDGTPVPMMITPGTDAKALLELGIPCYGFAPLRLEADFPFLSLFHGHDERVPVSALAFGLPVLADVVARFALRDP
ncbi:MAG TPA: M20/M25/M40 family metallo-hydrolase [Candidatus Limnocylindria bacterium]|nr:M20/M25/M40 family metallo-hydrolase [Candidatus Limnocylindria bacterium]